MRVLIIYYSILRILSIKNNYKELHYKRVRTR